MSETILRELTLAEQQAAVRARIAQRQRDLGFPVTEPPDLYRSPSADNPDEVMALGVEEPQELDDAQQRAWADRTIARNVEAFRAAADHAAPAVEQAPTADFRVMLAAAITAYDTAAAVADAADAAVDRAAQQMEVADGAVAEFAGLDDHITAHAIQCVRDGKEVTLPDHLRTAQMHRIEAVEHSRTLHTIWGQLVSESQTARVTVAAAVGRRNTVASHILYAHADKLATELEAAQERVALLGRQLRSTGDCWLVLCNGVSRSVGLSSYARETLLRPREEPQLDQEYAALMQRWFETLQQDASAEVQ